MGIVKGPQPLVVINLLYNGSLVGGDTRNITMRRGMYVYVLPKAPQPLVVPILLYNGSLVGVILGTLLGGEVSTYRYCQRPPLWYQNSCIMGSLGGSDTIGDTCRRAYATLWYFM